MNNIMRWERYSPVGIGLEDMFQRLDAFADSGNASYPPYNILKLDDDRQQLQVALAGWSKDDITVAVERKVLNISVQKPDEAEVGEYVHKGVSARTFSRNWQLSDDTQIEDVTYIDGMLKVTLKRQIREEDKRFTFPIS